jgi:hypothetical protein
MLNVFGALGDSEGDRYSDIFSDDKEADGFLTYIATHQEDEPFVAMKTRTSKTRMVLVFISYIE